MADSTDGLSTRGKVWLFAAPVLLVGGGILAANVVHEKLNEDHYVVDTSPPDGAALYTKNCAYCHGPTGMADGTAAISPRARHFGFDKFRFATTPNAVPCDDDLMRILKNGIPGSAMPKFEMSKDECEAVIGHVRTLARAGVYRRWMKKALKEDPTDPAYDEVVKKIEAETTVVPPISVPSLPPVQSLANGKKLFDTSCAGCHGPLGKGDGPQEQKTDDGTPIRPRDLTTGIYKGGGRTEDLYARIFLGVPGTPMPATTTLAPQDMADLIGYVKSFTGK
jgi:mono/diheme cytochrome c family protein